MPSLNKALIMGNITRDPELRVTPKGTPICQFGVAVNRKFKLESGESREEVTFLDVEAWGKQGETIAKYCTKGDPIYVEGRLRLDQWEDKDTKEKRSKIKIVLEQFQFLASAKGGKQGEQAEQAPDRTGPAKPAPKPAASGDAVEEDVPF